ncbi:hypothetical protein DFH28DRAFT_933326 [Melampsora americana]|nr:hypothetical protein DFH28DRAFT_933326 [Melampsora americana]
MDDQDISKSATANTTSKTDSNQNQLNTPTGKPSKTLPPNVKSISLDKTNTQNQLEPISSTTNKTSKVTLDKGHPNYSTFISSEAVHDIIESTLEKTNNEDNSQSKIPNKTCEDDPSNMDSKSITCQDCSSQTANLKVINVPSAHLEEKNQPVIDHSPQQVSQQSPQVSSDLFVISPTLASTDSLSYTSAMISISQNFTSDCPNSACTITEADNQKRSLSPETSSNLTNIRGKLKTSWTFSSHQTEDVNSFQTTSKSTLSPGTSSGTRNV